MNSVIITGADGFIGENLTLALAEKGITVYALVYTESSIQSYASLKNVHAIQFDLQNIYDVKEKLPMNVDVLYHLAWMGVSTAQKNDAVVQLKNINYGLEIMRLASQLYVGKVVYPGSVSEYAYSNVPVNGYNEPSPSDFYSAAKVATHYICDIFAKQNNIDFNWVLISSIYGPGRDDDNLISYSIKTLLNGEKPSFTKLEQKWDYIFIDDLIQALYCIGDKGKKGAVYPIGSGLNKSLLEYVTIVRNKINESLPIGVGDLPYKNSRIDNSVVDISKLKEDTGFVPAYTFELAIQKTIDYFITQRELKAEDTNME